MDNGKNKDDNNVSAATTFNSLPNHSSFTFLANFFYTAANSCSFALVIRDLLFYVSS